MTFEEDLEQSITIYENLIHNTAVRTKQMIDELGSVEALSRLVTSSYIQKGFRALVPENIDYTFESLITRHEKLFQREIVEAAQFRLNNYKNL